MARLPQVSLAVGASKFQVLVLSTFFWGPRVMVALVVPRTFAFWLQSAVLPQASVARHVRVASKVLPQWPTVLVTVLRTPGLKLSAMGTWDGEQPRRRALQKCNATCNHRVGFLMAENMTTMSASTLRSRLSQSTQNASFSFLPGDQFLLRRIGVKPRDERCPSCNSIIYSRRHDRCGVCERMLPE